MSVQLSDELATAVRESLPMPAVRLDVVAGSPNRDAVLMRATDAYVLVARSEAESDWLGSFLPGGSRRWVTTGSLMFDVDDWQVTCLVRDDVPALASV